MSESVVNEKALVKDKAPSIEKLTEWLDVFGRGKQLPDHVKKLFLEICGAYHLNPFKKEIHLVPFWNKATKQYDYAPIIGYEVYLKRAERTQLLDGWECHTEGELNINNTTYPERAVVTIWRKDRSKPLIWSVLFSEVAQWAKDAKTGKEYLTSFWHSQPDFQLKKVAISQGMRLDFPDELGGMAYEYPYTDEMENSNTGIRMPQSLSGEKSESDNTEEIIGTADVMPEADTPEPQVTEPSTKEEGEQPELAGDGNGEIDYF